MKAGFGREQRAGDDVLGMPASAATASVTHLSSAARWWRSARVITSHAVNAHPASPPTATAAMVRPGASPASKRLTVIATPNPKPAPSARVKRLSGPRGRQRRAG